MRDNHPVVMAFKAAMKYIELSPCDYDIHADQFEAWKELQSRLKHPSVCGSLAHQFVPSGIDDGSEYPVKCRACGKVGRKALPPGYVVTTFQGGYMLTCD